MSRDRDVTLEEETEEEHHTTEEEEAYQKAYEEMGGDEFLEQFVGANLKTGVGMCWINDTRVCAQDCMAYNNTGSEGGDHPCLILAMGHQVLEPILDQKDGQIKLVEKISRNLEDLNRTFSSLANVIQQVISRMR